RLDLAFLENAEIPAEAPAAADLIEQFRAAPVARDLHARIPRGRSLEERRTGAPDIADADGVFGRTQDREVLAEPAERKIRPGQLFAPGGIVIGAVREHRHVGPAVVPVVGLGVAVEVSVPDTDLAGDGPLAEPRAHP